MTNEITPFDSSWPITLLSDSMNEKLNDAENIASNVYSSILQVAPTVLAADKTAKAAQGGEYVLKMTEEIKEKLKSNEYKMVTENNNLYAQLRGPQGYSTKIPVEWKDFAVDPTAVTMALEMAAMKKQLDEISEQLNVIDSNVKDVAKGQQNDRVGQYYSAVSQYLEARAMDDCDLKNIVIGQAIQSLSDAVFQLKMDMDSNIQYLASGEYKHARGKRVDLIDAHMQNIDIDFCYIHQSFMLKAAIYCEQNQIQAMTSAIDQYSYFIDKVIVKNAGMLAQLDLKDNGAESGVWNVRAKFKIDMSSLKRPQLQENSESQIKISLGSKEKEYV